MPIQYVNVGPGGRFEKSGAYTTSAGEIDALFEELKESNKKSLVLHFHGGLVPEAAGVEVAKKMAPVYSAAGAVPLTFVWETGLMETFCDKLLHISDIDLYQKLLRWLLRRVALRMVKGVGIEATAGISTEKIDKELTEDKPFASYDDPAISGAAVSGGIAVSAFNLNNLKAELEAEFKQDLDGDETARKDFKALAVSKFGAQSKGLINSLKPEQLLAAVAYRVLKRYVDGRDHGFYPTVVEELLRGLGFDRLGAEVWEQMKEKARVMWESNVGLQGDKRRVGRYVMEKIKDLLKKRPDFRIDLVGHSAGSIAICELLRAAGDDFSVNTIAFLAPAGLSKLGVAELARHPKRFKEFRCYTMADDYEREDSLVPRVYTRSLLYFVSGVLEKGEVDAPIMGMMRHASKQGSFANGPAAEWANFISQPGRLVLSDSTVLNPHAAVGYRTASRSHGGFDDDPPTRESLTELLRV